MRASASSSSKIVAFSEWSGWAGYPGAGRIPWYGSVISSAAVNGSSGRVTPKFAADDGVHVLGEGFGDAVGEGLDEDRGVVVACGLVPLTDG